MSGVIPPKNIFYMLSYAFQVLSQNGYKSIATEDFRNIADMFTAILNKGIESQIKRYLYRDYKEKTEELSTLRGSIKVTESINQMSFFYKRLVCSFDEFSVDSYMNRILKSTMIILLKADVSPERKKSLKNLLPYFNSVQVIDINRINWKFHFNQNNQTYRMLMGICFLTIKGLLQSQSQGTKKVMDFLDEQRMCHLYEKFVLEYYKKHFRYLNPSANFVDWAAEGETDFLPAMKTDITLADKNKVLIIDTKYYYKRMQYSQYGTESYHSSNIYQILSYVKNKQAKFEGEVSGMLLYAKTDEDIPNKNFTILGNRFSVQSLDLSLDFSEIEKQLYRIIESSFSFSI